MKNYIQPSKNNLIGDYELAYELATVQALPIVRSDFLFSQSKFFELYARNCLAMFFLQFKEFELYWGAIFFKDLFTHFHDFSSQSGVVILVPPKQEVE